jgi:hypothetical protein
MQSVQKTVIFIFIAVKTLNSLRQYYLHKRDFQNLEDADLNIFHVNLEETK